MVLGGKRFLALVHVLGEEADTTITNAGLRFDAGHAIPHHRAVTLLTKEPDTLAWIDDLFEPRDVFYDVGANVGVFSLYAARTKDAVVMAFEPAAENYRILNRNIALNGLSDRITALNIALHDKTTLSHLALSAPLPGKAGHTFDSGGLGITQAVLGFRLDDFVRQFDVPVPNHVKIDVDGNDLLVLDGMATLLSDHRLKSVAIEINPAWGDDAVPPALAAAGFSALTGDRYVNRAYMAGNFARNRFFARAAP